MKNPTQTRIQELMNEKKRIEAKLELIKKELRNLILKNHGRQSTN